MKEVKPPKKPLIFYYLCAFVMIVLLNQLLFPSVWAPRIQEVDYSTFLSMLDEEKVAQVDVQSNQILFIDNEDPANYYCTGVMDDPNLVDRLEQSGATTINGDNITTGTIYADIIHLGGQMDVYQTAYGFSLGGYIGYMSGMSASGSSTPGIAIASSNEAAVVICTTNGARMGCDGVSTVTCTGTQVEIYSAYSVFLEGDTVYINGEPAATSDARLKTDARQDVDSYLGVFDKLRPVTFIYEGHKRRHMGLIAQEVQQTLADEGISEADFAALCTEPVSEKFPEGLYTLRYGEIQIMTIAKVQQMAREIAGLKEQVAALSAGKE